MKRLFIILAAFVLLTSCGQTAEPEATATPTAAPVDIRKRFLAAQAKWTPDMWAVFAKIVDSFTETKKTDTE